MAAPSADPLADPLAPLLVPQSIPALEHPLAAPLEALSAALVVAPVSDPLAAPLAALLEALLAAPGPLVAPLADPLKALLADPLKALLAAPHERRHGLPPGTQALLDIEKDPGLSAALKSLESQEQYFGTQFERILTRKAELNTDIFNIVGFFSVFQGVILTAVSSLKSDTFSTCKIILWPTLLTCLATFAAIVAFLMKWSLRRNIEKTLESNRAALREVSIQSILLKHKGRAYEYEERQARFRRPTERLFYTKMTLVILGMLIFSLIFIMAYFAILCDRLVIRKWEGGL